MTVQTFPTGRRMDEHDSFPQRVWQIVASVPEGYVTTYGDVARLAGSPRAARQVGGVLKRLPEGSSQGRRRVCRDVAGRAPTHLYSLFFFILRNVINPFVC